MGVGGGNLLAMGQAASGKVVRCGSRQCARQQCAAASHLGETERRITQNGQSVRNNVQSLSRGEKCRGTRHGSLAAKRRPRLTCPRAWCRVRQARGRRRTGGGGSSAGQW